MSIKYKRLAVAFSGISNSGKTTLIAKLSQKLRQLNCKVCIIKHDPKDKAIVDTKGKDSYIFSSTGADVAILSPKRKSVFIQNPNLQYDLNSLVSCFDDFDYLFIEGFKNIALPRVLVARNNIEEDYYKVCDVVATDGSVDIKKDIKCLNLNDVDEVLLWINENALICHR